MLTRDIAGVQEGWDKPEQEHGDDLRADAERTWTWGSDRIGFIQSEIDRINEPLKKKRQKVDFVTKKGRKLCSICCSTILVAGQNCFDKLASKL